jgi:hypothetical protein
MKCINLAVPFAAILASGQALAGTIIDTNLASNAVAIVNIDGKGDGARSFDGTQDKWFDPFNIDGHPLTITLDPGVYTFTLVNPTDAKKLNPDLTAGQLQTIYTAWSYNSPWITDYYVWDSEALIKPGTPELFAGAIDAHIPDYYSYPGASSQGFLEAGQAYWAATHGGVANKIWLGGRFTGIESDSFTVLRTQTLVFGIPDYYLPDNQGGVSVIIQSVPEPGMMLVMTGGLAGLIARRRRRHLV